jgi:hypothetical protein
MYSRIPTISSQRLSPVIDKTTIQTIGFIDVNQLFAGFTVQPVIEGAEPGITLTVV